MITFKQFLEEGKKKKKPLFKKNEIMKTLKKQGGIGGKAVEKYINSPEYEPYRSYTVPKHTNG